MGVMSNYYEKGSAWGCMNLFFTFHYQSGNFCIFISLNKMSDSIKLWFKNETTMQENSFCSYLVVSIWVCQGSRQNLTLFPNLFPFYLSCSLNCLSCCHGNCPCTSSWRQGANIIGCQRLGGIHIVSIVRRGCRIIISTTCIELKKQ